ncbi:MAG: lactate utilization protein B [Rhodopila sp.]
MKDKPGSSGLIHPELQSRQNEAPVSPDGERLQHAEGTSQPLRSKHAEPQPRGAKVDGRRPIDQQEAAARFIAAPEHAKMHDERLWDLRGKRDAQMHGIPEWEELRDLASQIKTHTLAHLDQYLEQFEAAAKANGVHVHWAVDGAAHNQIVHSILRDHGAKSLIKSKSMLTEECGFRHYMAGTGIEVVETDLGERIQQLDDEAPSHVVVPAVHKLRRDVAEVFARALGGDPETDDVPALARLQRDTTRPLILSADAGLTGANFAIAETGSFVVCTNEGNADLSANVPPLHIASIGIEKLIPRIEHLGVFIRLLSRSALGSPITQYTSHFRRPRGGSEMHIVLVDNGRSARLGMEQFWTSLKCIRCGACMNTCPVFRRSGGLSYGATYTGPIGLILDPTFDKRKYSGLPFASTLNGSCSDVCPVKINIHEQIFAWRKVLAEEHEIPLAKRQMMKAAGAVLSRPALYRAAIATADSALRHLPKFAVYNRWNTWTEGREMPPAPKETFHTWYARTHPPAASDKDTRTHPPATGGKGTPNESA